MRLAADYEHPTPHGGRCRVRIYAPEEQEDAFVVICTELRNNPGQSVTNAAEDTAAGVVLQHALPTNRTVFIEHYESGGRGNDHDPHTFYLLTFSNTDPAPMLRAGVWSVELGEPSWKPLTRETVEALIGRSQK